MKSYIIKSLKYIISICLISSYCFILFNSTHINVPFEYKRFYLDKMFMDWPGINGLDYSLNTNLMFGLEHNDSLVKCRGTGWNNFEDNGTWTQDDAKLYLNLKEEVKDDKTLKLVLGKAMPDIKVHILINDKEVSSFQPDQYKQEYEFKIPKEFFGDKFLCLNFKVDNCSYITDVNKPREKILAGMFVESINLGT
ncbi:hypothetical protein CLOBL_45640 [Clostridium sp. BL-8]|nr:hypothetical protein CLOBL_45640 [Clostridium sp. BL-8]